MKLKPWIQLIKERFPLGSYLPMVTVFTVANMIIAAHFQSETNLPLAKLLLIWCLTLSFFFRLRLFDELKDVEVDKINNPNRPLARGLIAITQVKAVIVVLVFLELLVSYQLGLNTLVIQAIAIGYSLLMYNEFFIGKFLRPHLTLYAVTHTAVSILLGYCIVAQYLNVAFWLFPSEVLIFGLINWSLFNLFEFARKTYAKEEESPTSDSYSKLYGSFGAFLLTASQSAAALFLLFSIDGVSIYLWVHIVLFVSLAIMSLPYILRGKANFYRLAWSVYIIVFYLVVIGMFK